MNIGVEREHSGTMGVRDEAAADEVEETKKSIMDTREKLSKHMRSTSTGHSEGQKKKSFYAPELIIITDEAQV